MTIPTLTTLPVAPARTDPPATFVTRADAFLAAIVTFQGEMNTSIGAMNTDIAGVNTNATAAAASATAAAASATAAANSAGAALWVSGQSYTTGQAAISGVDFQTYRAESNTSGTTDPSADSNWTAISGTFPNQSGNAGKFLSTDGTDPLWGDVSASPTLEAVASGTLANGDTVVINSNGTVSAAGLTTTDTPVIGSVVTFESGNSQYISSCYDTSNDKVVIAYQDANDGEKGKAVVGTVANGQITFGTPVIFDSSTVYYIDIAYDSNASKVVVVYRDEGNSSSGTAIVGTVSGTSISFGSPSVYHSGNANRNGVVFDSSANKVIIANNRTGNQIQVSLGTISGTSISFGTSATISNAQEDQDRLTLSYDINANKTLIAYKGTSGYSECAVVSVSGTTVSVGTSVSATNYTASDSSVVYDSAANKHLVFWRKSGTNYMTGRVATISGTTVTFGTEASLTNEYARYYGFSFDTTVNKIILAYYTNTSSTSKTIQATISGTSVTTSSATTYLSQSTSYNELVYDPDSERTIFAFYQSGGKSLVYASTTTTSNLTSENYIGISDAAYSNGATATIQLVGTVDDAQSSLTAGQYYFVQENGSIALTPDTTPVFAGTAVSATKLLIGERNELPYQTGNSGKFLTTNGTVASWGSAGVTSTADVSVSGGNQYTVTGIPSTATHIWINVKNFQATAGLATYIQLGTSGSIVTSGYSSSAAWLRSGPDIDSETVTNSLTFFKTDGTNRVCSGVVHLSKQATNTWVMSFVGGGNPVANIFLGGGSSPTLSGVLTQFRIKNDAGNFTGGTFNVSYMQD